MSGEVWKPRTLDDCCSHLNVSVESTVTYRPEPIDAVHALATSLAARNQSRNFDRAYEHLGIDPESWRAASILARRSTDGKTYVAHVNAQPSGSARAPGSWGGAVTMLQRAITCLAQVPFQD